MNFQQFLKESIGKGPYPGVRPVLICKDGFSMSVQGSEFHYSIPKKMCDSYDTMEIGFPSKLEPVLLPFCEDISNPLDTVYSYVPVVTIQVVIDAHGGIDEAKTFPV